jgi:cob(I)yrinic acid a,c-diamide adenosyltransferase
MKDKGYVQVYTGNGKGKTTCALGLCLRAVCAGYSVFFGQFLKGRDYSELKAVDFLPNFTIRQYGSEKFVFNSPSDEDILLAKNAIDDIKKEISNYDVVVLDEINIALHKNLISLQDVLDIINLKPENTELVLTGRYAHEKIIQCADLVSNIDEIKHYYTKGVNARIGIEK